MANYFLNASCIGSWQLFHLNVFRNMPRPSPRHLHNWMQETINQDPGIIESNASTQIRGSTIVSIHNKGIRYQGTPRDLDETRM